MYLAVYEVHQARVALHEDIGTISDGKFTVIFNLKRLNVLNFVHSITSVERTQLAEKLNNLDSITGVLLRFIDQISQSVLRSWGVLTKNRLNYKEKTS